ncbi:hypothetical protein SDJN03_08537, partial [Cucurbita argyrosperma subsp. sororia]
MCGYSSLHGVALSKATTLWHNEHQKLTPNSSYAFRRTGGGQSTIVPTCTTTTNCPFYTLKRYQMSVPEKTWPRRRGLRRSPAGIENLETRKN